MNDGSMKRRVAIMAAWVVAATLALGCSGRTAQSESAASQSVPQAAPTQVAESPQRYEGYLEIADCNVARGWVWQPSEPDKSLTVDVFYGDRLLATVVADKLRPDVKDAQKGTGRYGFQATMPAAV